MRRDEKTSLSKPLCLLPTPRSHSKHQVLYQLLSFRRIDGSIREYARPSGINDLKLRAELGIDQCR